MKVLFKKLVPHAIIPERSNPTDAGMDLSSSEDVIVPPDGGRRLVSTGLKIAIVPNYSKSFIEIEDGSFQNFKVSDSVENIVGNVESLEDCIVNNEVLEYVWQAEVRPRSGLAWKKGVTVLNSPGTVDSGYRGELKVIVVNHGDEPFEIKRGDRIAQLIFTRSYLLDVQEVDEFPDETSRGVGGFGSTGV